MIGPRRVARGRRKVRRKERASSTKHIRDVHVPRVKINKERSAIAALAEILLCQWRVKKKCIIENDGGNEQGANRLPNRHESAKLNKKSGPNKYWQHINTDK